MSPLTPKEQITPVIETGTANLIAVLSSLIIIVCTISTVVFLSIGYVCGWFSHKYKHSRASKSTSDSAKKNVFHLQAMDQSQLPQSPGLELQQDSTLEHLELNENVAYGQIIVR